MSFVAAGPVVRWYNAPGFRRPIPPFAGPTPVRGHRMSTPIVLFAIAGVFLVLYLMRRKSRMGKED
jgi:hypothetical protein